MKPIFIPVIAVLLLGSCQSMQSDDPSSLSFKIPDGSTLSLNMDLDIPDNRTHALLQAGKLITDRDRDAYRLHCRFDVKAFGPRTIEPEVFEIRRTESGQEWISEQVGSLRYYTDMFLDSNKGTDVIKLTCQREGGKTDRTFAIAEIEPVLGDYFTLTFAQGKPARSRY